MRVSLRELRDLAAFVCEAYEARMERLAEQRSTYKLLGALALAALLAVGL